MRIIIRVDASTDIGTGHVIRCLTLATSLKKNQHEVTFICRDLSGNLISHIEQDGFDVITLTQADDASDNNDYVSHAGWLKVGWQTDADESSRSLSNVGDIDWIIIDHYALDKRWESELRHHSRFMMAIDDLADREHDVDILLDQNLYPDMEKRYAHLVTEVCLMLIGPQYTLLREEFTSLLADIEPRTQLKNLLVFFGGVDAQNLTMKTIDAIQQLDKNLNVTVIIGNTNPHKQALFDRCSKSENIQCFHNVTNMAQLMLKADLAIGAGGTTTWERCYLGLPAIVVTLAHNQAAVNRAVAEQGACILAGDTTVTENEIKTQLSGIIDNPEFIHEISVSALAIMQNHLGVKSVTRTMESFDA